MPLRPLSAQEEMENTLMKPHLFKEGKYILDTAFEATEFPKWKYRCVKAFKIVKKGDRKVKVAFPKEESILLKTAAAEAKLVGTWFDSPRKALLAFKKEKVKHAAA